jgi:hypothetical protein
MTGKNVATERAASGQASRSHVESLLDQALAETFPASDPVAIVCEDRRAAKPERAGQAAEEGEPSGATSRPADPQ